MTQYLAKQFWSRLPAFKPEIFELLLVAFEDSCVIQYCTTLSLCIKNLNCSKCIIMHYRTPP